MTIEPTGKSASDHYNSIIIMTLYNIKCAIFVVILQVNVSGCDRCSFANAVLSQYKVHAHNKLPATPAREPDSHLLLTVKLLYITLPQKCHSTND